MHPMKGLFLISSIVVGVTSAEAKTPDWAKSNTQSLSGKILKTTCSGTGPSIDLARKDALDSCRLSARQQLVSDFKIRSLTIQTEKSSGFHEEISESTHYTGLTCLPEKDEVDELDGAYRVWIQCRFDLSRVKVVSAEDSQITSPHRPESEDSIKNRGSLSKVEQRDLVSKDPQYLISDQSVLTLSSVPPCESLIIRGLKARVITCTENPSSIVLNQSDKEIIVRAKGHKPKTISLGNEKRRQDHVSIILDPL